MPGCRLHHTREHDLNPRPTRNVRIAEKIFLLVEIRFSCKDSAFNHRKQAPLRIVCLSFISAERLGRRDGQSPYAEMLFGSLARPLRHAQADRLIAGGADSSKSLVFWRPGLAGERNVDSIFDSLSFRETAAVGTSGIIPTVTMADRCAPRFAIRLR
jgi:hypothetical protein